MLQFYRRIAFLMDRFGLSYRALSDMTGIPHATLQRYATGTTTKISKDRLSKIANALNTTPAYLLGYVRDPDYSFTEAEKSKYLSSLRKLCEMRKELLQNKMGVPNPFEIYLNGSTELTLDEACLISDNLCIPFESMVEWNFSISETSKYEDSAIEEHLSVLQSICTDDDMLNPYELKIKSEEIYPRRIRVVTEYLKDNRATLQKLMLAAEKQ